MDNYHKSGWQINHKLLFVCTDHSTLGSKIWYGEEKCTTQLNWNENKTSILIAISSGQGLPELLHVPLTVTPSSSAGTVAKYVLNNQIKLICSLSISSPSWTDALLPGWDPSAQRNARSCRQLLLHRSVGPQTRRSPRPHQGWHSPLRSALRQAVSSLL